MMVLQGSLDLKVLKEIQDPLDLLVLEAVKYVCYMLIACILINVL